MTGKLSSPEEVKRRMEANFASRGYLLPHQGLFAAAMPALQDAYPAIYSALTLQQNHLTPMEREFVWLGVLAAGGEHVGTHHVKLFLDLGGTHKQAEVVFRLVALAAGTPRSFEFFDRHWQKYFNGVDARQAYRDAAVALLGDSGIAEPLARCILLGVHVTLGQDWGIEAELEAAYAIGTDEGKLAESTCLPLWLAGMNRTIDSCVIWIRLIREGRVNASESLRAWAEMEQGPMKI